MSLFVYFFSLPLFRVRGLTGLLAVVAAKTGRAVAFAIVLAAVCEMETFKAWKHAVKTWWAIGIVL